jgi:hypothetical protein
MLTRASSDGNRPGDPKHAPSKGSLVPSVTVARQATLRAHGARKPALLLPHVSTSSCSRSRSPGDVGRVDDPDSDKESQPATGREPNSTGRTSTAPVHSLPLSRIRRVAAASVQSKSLARAKPTRRPGYRRNQDHDNGGRHPPWCISSALAAAPRSARTQTGAASSAEICISAVTGLRRSAR